MPDALAQARIAAVLTRLTELRDSSAVPDQPDRRWVDEWLHHSYLNFWPHTADPPTPRAHF